MKKVSVFLMFLLAAWCFEACNNDKAKDPVEAAEEANENNKAVKEDDSEFMVKAANGGMLEVELGKIAATKAKSQKVKDYGNMMVTDHTKANEELKALAATKNITLPATLSEDEQKHINDLNQKKGVDFDKEYIDMMVKDHKKDIDEFEEASKEAKDTDVKTWASKTLPTLRTHLASAQSINDAMKK